MWHYGCIGGKYPGTGICGDAYDCFSPGGLCFPGGLDLHHISVGQDTVHPVYILPGVMDSYGSGSWGMFCGREKKNSRLRKAAEGRRS